MFFWSSEVRGYNFSIESLNIVGKVSHRSNENDNPYDIKVNIFNLVKNHWIVDLRIYNDKILGLNEYLGEKHEWWKNC